MRKYYGLIRDCYKHEAGMGTTGKIFGVPKGQQTQFFNEIKLIDTIFKLSDSDRFFITVDSSTKIKSVMVPKNQMCRFQFLEIFVRASIERHFTLEKNTKSEAEAL